MTKVVALDEVLRLLDSVGVTFQNIARLVSAAEFGEANTSIEEFVPIQAGTEPKKRTRRTKAEIEGEKITGGEIITHVPVGVTIETPAPITPAAPSEPVVIDMPVVTIAPVNVEIPAPDANALFGVAPVSRFGVTEAAGADVNLLRTIAQQIIVASATHGDNTFAGTVAMPLITKVLGAPPTSDPFTSLVSLGRGHEFLSKLEKAFMLVELKQPVDINAL